MVAVQHFRALRLRDGLRTESSLEARIAGLLFEKSGKSVVEMTRSFP